MTTLVRITEIYSFGPLLTDFTVATLNPATMETLGLFRGDTIIVRCVASWPPHSAYLMNILVQWEKEARHRLDLPEFG
jgi:hypothetical protein